MGPARNAVGKIGSRVPFGSCAKILLRDLRGQGNVNHSRDMGSMPLHGAAAGATSHFLPAIRVHSSMGRSVNMARANASFNC